MLHSLAQANVALQRQHTLRRDTPVTAEQPVQGLHRPLAIEEMHADVSQTGCAGQVMRCS